MILIQLMRSKLTKPSVITVHRPLRPHSLRLQSQTAPTSTVHIGHTPSYAPSASRPMEPHSKPQTPHQALAMCLTRTHQLRGPTLRPLCQNILHRARRCSISARQRATSSIHGRAGQSRPLLSASMLKPSLVVYGDAVADLGI